MWRGFGWLRERMAKISGFMFTSIRTPIGGVFWGKHTPGAELFDLFDNFA